jgi:hypothetical protein
MTNLVRLSALATKEKIKNLSDPQKYPVLSKHLRHYRIAEYFEEEDPIQRNRNNLSKSKSAIKFQVKVLKH